MDPRTEKSLEEWRRAVSTLGGELVDIESNPTVALARTGCLEGGSAAAWTAADEGVVAAWEIYRILDERLDEAGRDPSRARQLLESASVPSPKGPNGAAGAFVAAEAAVATATTLIDRLATAWGELTTRAATAVSSATDAGDLSTARAARSLGDLLARDPLAVSESDLAAIEALSETAARKHEAGKLATSRIDLDLAQARTALTALDADLQTAGELLTHAASRVVGVQVVSPVRDIDNLADWLDRIASLAARDAAHAASDLRDWVAAAQARRAELDAALAPAREGLRRREEARGLWSGLRAKAAARRLDEQTEVVAALEAAHDELWNAPCDLGAADAALARLAALLESSPAGSA